MRLPRFLSGFAAAISLLVSPLAAQDDSTDTEKAALEGALNRGLALYLYDQAAWHGTDAMLEDLENASELGIRGWIVNEVEKGYEVVFYRPSKSGFEAVWSGVHNDNANTVSARTRYAAGERALTVTEAAKAAASKLPLNEEMQRCSEKPFNTVVMPTGKKDGSLYVYYLVPQTTYDAVPLGGHYRFEVRDGEIVARRAFTNSCISLSLKGKDGKGRPEGLVISHVLDSVPTEIHVFSSYAASVPIYVAIQDNGKLWATESIEGQPRFRLIKGAE